MTPLRSITLDVTDPVAAEKFYSNFGAGDHVAVRASDEPTSGFRGFVLSLVVSQPGTVDHFLTAAVDNGATVLKPAKKSFWGYGGVVQAPDGTLWKVATSAKKDSGPAGTHFDDLVLLLGVEDVKQSKQFYVDRGLGVAKSFGSRYVEFDTLGSPVKLALYGRRAAAKDAGVPTEGTGSHRVMVEGDLGTFTDPDGFLWQGADV